MNARTVLGLVVVLAGAALIACHSAGPNCCPESMPCPVSLKMCSSLLPTPAPVAPSAQFPAAAAPAKVESH